MDMILVKSKSGMRMVDRNGKKGFLELSEPVWAPDDNFKACTACQATFDMFRRKHHCRRCGGVFCRSCATEKVIPMRLQFIDPVRMCVRCQKLSKWENDFFNNHLKGLKEGCRLSVQDETGEKGVASVSLGGDGSLLQVVGEGGAAIPILLDEVVSFQVSQEGSDGVHTLTVDAFGGRNIVLCKTEDPTSVRFLSGLRKALRMCAKADQQKSGPSANDAGR